MSAAGHLSTSRVTRPSSATDNPHSHDVVFLIDPEEEKVVGVTSGIHHLLGFETIDIVGRKFSSLCVHNPAGENVDQDPARYWGSGETVPITFHCSNQPPRTFDVTFSPMHANDRRHLKMAVLHEPGSLTANIEPAVRQQIEEQALRTILHEVHKEPVEYQFLSKISHQVRTPLGVILSSAGILGRYDESLDTTQRQEYLDAISDSVQRITHLLEDVVCLSRLETGTIACQPKPENLLHLCHEVIEEARAAESKAIPVTFLHANIPQQVHCDENLLRLILIHLLGNAIKFTLDNQPIQLKLKHEGAFCSLSVIDSGIGIPACDIHALYEPFHRCSNTGDIPGNGLGLAIVSKCVALHGGTIHCESSPRAGTTFRVMLPLFDQPR